MCVDHSINCLCGKNAASFNFRDEVLPFEAITKLHCPVCSQGVSHDPATMLADNGWIIGFDMEVARFMLQKIAPADQVTPEFIFDEGYCTWRGVTPTDHIDSVKEREALAPACQDGSQTLLRGDQELGQQQDGASRTGRMEESK